MKGNMEMMADMMMKMSKMSSHHEKKIDEQYKKELQKVKKELDPSFLRRHLLFSELDNTFFYCMYSSVN